MFIKPFKKEHCTCT